MSTRVDISREISRIYTAVITTIPATLATLATSVAVAAVKTVVDALAVTAGAYDQVAKASGVAGSLFQHLTHVQDRIADTMADLGDASGSTLTSIYAILGNPGTALATTIATIAADVVETATGRIQCPTYINATLDTNTNTTTIMTCATQSVDLLSANLELVAAAHASTTSFRLEHRRGATVIRTLILDAQAPGTYFTAAGLNVAWEDAAEPFAVGDLLVLVATGAAGGTNSVKVRARIAARVDGGTMTVTP